MEIVYLLVMLGLLVMGVVVWAFFWAVGNGQFDDLEGPAHRVIMDKDESLSRAANHDSNESTGKSGLL